MTPYLGKFVLIFTQYFAILEGRRRCASSVQVISFGESPNPAKRSEQPVLSLGAGAER